MGRTTATSCGELCGFCVEHLPVLSDLWEAALNSARLDLFRNVPVCFGKWQWFLCHSAYATLLALVFLACLACIWECFESFRSAVCSSDAPTQASTRSFHIGSW